MNLLFKVLFQPHLEPSHYHASVLMWRFEVIFFFCHLLFFRSELEPEGLCCWNWGLKTFKYLNTDNDSTFYRFSLHLYVYIYLKKTEKTTKWVKETRAFRPSVCELCKATVILRKLTQNLGNTMKKITIKWHKLMYVLCLQCYKGIQ